MDLASSLNVHEPVLKNHAVYLNNADKSTVHHGIESLPQDIFDLVSRLPALNHAGMHAVTCFMNFVSGYMHSCFSAHVLAYRL